jgi:hypothetical protein
MSRSVTLLVVSVLAVGCTKQGAYVSQAQLAGGSLHPFTAQCERACRSESPRTRSYYLACLSRCPGIVFSTVTCPTEPSPLLCEAGTKFEADRGLAITGSVVAYFVLSLYAIAASLGADRS